LPSVCTAWAKSASDLPTGTPMPFIPEACRAWLISQIHRGRPTSGPRDTIVLREIPTCATADSWPQGSLGRWDELHVDYDSVQNSTTISLLDLVVGDGVKLNVYGTYVGRTPSRHATSLGLTFRSHDSNWQAVPVWSLQLPDSTVAPYKGHYYSSQIQDGTAADFLEIAMPIADLTRIVGARCVVGFIALGTPVVLRRAQVAAIERLVASLSHAP
jgi:hypothetical protein